MVVVNGKSDLSDLDCHAKCQKELQMVQKKKRIDLDATGDKHTNALLALLKCQVKSTKLCKLEDKEYTLCHQSFMGVGSYKGKKHCGDPMEALYQCIRNS